MLIKLIYKHIGHVLIKNELFVKGITPFWSGMCFLKCQIWKSKYFLCLFHFSKSFMCLKKISVQYLFRKALCAYKNKLETSTYKIKQRTRESGKN